MSTDHILAAQMWTWADPMIKRDSHGRILIVNAAFLQLYGGTVESWTGNPIQGWPNPKAVGESSRFESRIPLPTGGETVYDWMECTLQDGTAMAMARDVTNYAQASAAPQLGARSEFAQPATQTAPEPVAEPQSMAMAAPVSAAPEQTLSPQQEAFQTAETAPVANPEPLFEPQVAPEPARIGTEPVHAQTPQTTEIPQTIETPAQPEQAIAAPAAAIATGLAGMAAVGTAAAQSVQAPITQPVAAPMPAAPVTQPVQTPAAQVQSPQTAPVAPPQIQAQPAAAPIPAAPPIAAVTPEQNLAPAAPVQPVQNEMPSAGAPVPAPAPTPASAEANNRDFERRALPIENGDAILGNNWRDAVIAKAVGVEEPAEIKDETPAAANVETGEQIRVLLAEDNAINALLTRTLLEADGCLCDVVEDGALAVEALKNNQYDMVFMDMRMPNMDGLEATRKIRSMGHNAKSLPIVALTANAFDDDRNACFDSGMNDFMTKPVSAEELSAMVKTHTSLEAEKIAS